MAVLSRASDKGLVYHVATTREELVNWMVQRSVLTVTFPKSGCFCVSVAQKSAASGSQIQRLSLLGARTERCCCESIMIQICVSIPPSAD